MNTEAIVYLLRKTSLTLKDIGALTPKQFNALLEELYYQEFGKKLTRNIPKQELSIDELANKKGIKMPSNRI